LLNILLRKAIARFLEVRFFVENAPQKRCRYAQPSICFRFTDRREFLPAFCSNNVNVVEPAVIETSAFGTGDRAMAGAASRLAGLTFPVG
jgi:hypothetical protein